MPVDLLSQIPPTAINIKGGLVGSLLGRGKVETIACNIIVISRGQNGWFAFSWEDYKRLCRHAVTIEERAILDELVSEGLLSLVEGKYFPTSKFIARLWDFVIQ
jgi:hypothetical protein